MLEGTDSIHLSRMLYAVVIIHILVHIAVCEPSIRLVPGSVSCKNCGRVELYIDGQWGTVCSNLWQEQDARVACRQLSFPDGGKPARYAAFGAGHGPIHMSHVDCRGNETSLQQCHSRSGASCTHEDDAGVVCESDVTASQTGDIMLVNGSSPNKGRLTVEYHGVLGTVCRDGWHIQDSKVVCRDLGFCGGSSVTHGDGAFGRGHGPVWLTEVNCTGSERKLERCHHAGWADNTCTHSYDVGVICQYCETGDVRLIGSSDDENSGIVVISNDGIWGTMCSDVWSDVEASVVCRSLGFGDGVAVTNDNFTLPVGSVWLSGVQCKGSEQHITDCYHDNKGSGGWGENNCRHYQDVAVSCMMSSPTSSTVGSTTKYPTDPTIKTTTSDTHTGVPDNNRDKLWIIIIVCVVAVIIAGVVVIVVCLVTRNKASKASKNYMLTQRGESNEYTLDDDDQPGACAMDPERMPSSTRKPRDSGIYQEIDDHKASTSGQLSNRMNSYVGNPNSPRRSPREGKSEPLPAVPDNSNDYLVAANVRQGAVVYTKDGATGGLTDQDVYTQIADNNDADYLEPLKLKT